MVLTTFIWPHGGQQVYLCCSFSRWTEHYLMTPVDGSPTVFQKVLDVPAGHHQFRFLVDGIWKCDGGQNVAADNYGLVNNAIIIVESGVSASMLHREPSMSRIMDVDEGLSSYSEQAAWIPDTEIDALRHWISRLLLNKTIYDILPISNKVSIIDVQLPVKRAFHIMFEEGLSVVPLWDDSRTNMAGMLTASDFILILRELQNNMRLLANEELEMHSVSAWKERKLQFYRKSNGPVVMHANPLIHVTDRECLKDVALKIVQNEISMVPIFKSSRQEGSCMPLLNLASLPLILKYVCSHFVESIRPIPCLQHPIYRIPLGTWLQGNGRAHGHHLEILRRDAPLCSALDLLLEGKISSIPIVDENGSLLDVYSRSDILSLAKGDTYARIQLDQTSMQQVLDQLNQANPHYSGGRRICHTCSRSTSFHEVMERLSHPGVRRLVVIDPSNRRVEGIISLRDVFTFLLG